MIINDKGQTVWFKSTPGKIPADFRVQQLGGKPVLTWWEGQLFVGDGDGVGQVYDHQLQARSRRSRPATATRSTCTSSRSRRRTPRSCSPTSATSATCARGAARRTRASWTTSSRRSTCAPARCCSSGTRSATSSPKESNVPPPTGHGFEWEYFHVNSAEITPDGNFLISARNTSTIYKIDRRTGKIIWRWAARSPTSSSARACASTGSTAPASRPTARSTSTTTRPRRRRARTRACSTLRLDEQAKTATLVSALKHPLGLLSASQGNVETLPNGNLFVGWGSQRWFTEFDAQRQRRLRRPARPRQRQLPRVPLPVGRRPVARRRRSSRPPTAARSPRA